MPFAIMQWKGTGANGTIYGIVDQDNPAKLPMPSSNGHWEDVYRIDESRFKFATEAKKAIAANGFFLMGGSYTFTESETANLPPHK